MESISLQVPGTEPLPGTDTALGWGMEYETVPGTILWRQRFTERLAPVDGSAPPLVFDQTAYPQALLGRLSHDIFTARWEALNKISLKILYASRLPERIYVTLAALFTVIVLVSSYFALATDDSTFFYGLFALIPVAFFGLLRYFSERRRMIAWHKTMADALETFNLHDNKVGVYWRHLVLPKMPVNDDDHAELEASVDMYVTAERTTSPVPARQEAHLPLPPVYTRNDGQDRHYAELESGEEEDITVF